jgi:ATP-binding cassette subfamily F protein uup
VILVDATGLAASRPGKPLFADLDVTVSSGDRLAVVGINGCGKSTLLGILAGTVEPEAGEVRRGRGVEVAALDQSPRLVGATLREALHHGAPAHDWEVEAVADRLGLGGEMDTPTEALSGGQAKRVALARALVSDAPLLVLDEPTNHLDIDAIAWLEERLAGHTGGLVLVTHDRHFLDRVTTKILELDRGTGHVHDGGYASYLEARVVRRDRAATAETKRRNLARSELEWLRRGAPARTSKPKARIEAAEKLLAGGSDADIRAGDLPLHASTPRLGDRVVELHGVGHRFGDTVLFSDVEMLLDPRERLGVVGANGTGKSTLLDIMSGRLVPTEGTVEVGTTARVSTYDQQGRELDPAMRVRDAVAGPDGVVDHHHNALMEAFWFDDDAQWAPIGTLSGGERRRLQLLLTLAERPNVLFLDEPTNDLDVDTLRALEEALLNYAGCAVVISHDRWFLDRIATHILAFEGDSQTVWFEGNYQDYEADRKRRLGAEADQPHRIKYRKLTRS